MALPSKVKPGDPVRAVDWNALIDCVRSAQLSPGSGVRITRTPGGTTLAVDKAVIKTVTLPQWPFQVVQISGGDPNTGKNPTIGVISDSHVINSADKDAYEEDNSDWGLLSDDETEGDFDLPDIGDKIWLQFTFDQDQNLTSIDLKYGPVGDDDWDGYPDPISINSDADPYQDYYHQIIAEATDPDNDPREGLTMTANDGTKVKIVQILKTNLTLVNAITTDDADQPGVAIMVTIPSNAPATSDDGNGDPINDISDIKTPWEFASDEEVFPFKVKLRSNPDTPGAFDFGVVYESLLLASPDHEDNVEITGLIDGDDGWVTWNGSDDIVWLEIEWSDWPDSYSASIKSYSNGDDWGGGEVEDDGEDQPTQVYARIVLAAIAADDQGNPVVDQRVRTHLQMVGGMEPSDSGETIDCIIPVAYPAADDLPDWMQGYGDWDNGYYVYFGDADADMVGESAAPIAAFALEVGDPNDDEASTMTLCVGDGDSSNDMLCFDSGSTDDSNEVCIQWIDYPEVSLTDNQGSPDDGNQINLNIEEGPELYLADDSGNEITVNINDGPLVQLDDSSEHDGNEINLNLNEGPELYLTDGEGNMLSVNITDGPEVYLEDSDGNTAGLNINDGPELYLEDGDGNACLDTTSLTFTDSDGNTTTLSDGDLDLGDDGTIEIGDDGSITVGDSVLSNGDLDLGDDGTIELGSDATIDSGTITIPAGVFSGNLDVGSLDCSGDGTFESNVSVASNLDCATLSGCDDSVWDMVTDNVDDSIRTALDTLSASIDCDSMTVTFSYSY